MSEKIIGIESKIERVIAGWKMLPEGCTVIAGLSGGADSLALTHFLFQRQERYGIRLVAAHVNHGLRGEEGDGDEDFVRSWCGRVGIPLQVLRSDVRKEAEQNRMGIEEYGRKLRYEFFASLLETPEDRIATAHTLSDSLETVLFRIAKGTGLKGLCGIPTVRGSIVRPLAEVTRAEVEEYCAYYGLKFVTDSSNADTRYERNRIRHEVIPQLKQLNPEFEKAAGHMIAQLREDYSFLERAAEGLANRARVDVGMYRIDCLSGEPDAVLARALLQIAADCGAGRMEYERVQELAACVRKGSGSLFLPGGIQCVCRGNTLFVLPEQKRIGAWSVPFQMPETKLPDGRILQIVQIPLESDKNPDKINNLLFNNRINYDTMINNILVRNRREGDSFRPAGRGVTKTLKKLFNEAKIPPWQRDRLVILEQGGEIVWVEGFGASESAAAGPQAGTVAEIRIKECKGC